ncbi:MAG: tetratricopeptide repeat protein [Verrucomicrobiae bacterium]|nr:tetratricopeptide repeat protein [Verrucomicrobiae bacterium]
MEPGNKANVLSTARDRRFQLIAVVLCVVTLAVYLPVVRHDFVNYDDPVYVTENAYVQAGLTLDSIAWAFSTGRSGNWHPITWLSLMLDSELYGTWPGGFHSTNLLLHTANTLLLFWLLHRLTGALWRSAFVAALFALHPLHVESVAWVAERKDVLSTFFGLLALMAYAQYARTSPNESAARRKRYFTTLALFALGLMSKAMLVTWPFVMLLLDFWPLRRIKSHFDTPTTRADAAETSPTEANARSEHAVPLKKLVLEKVPFLVLSACISVITLITQGQTDALASSRLLPVANRLAHVPVAYLRYIGKTIWPDGLAVFYPYKMIGWDTALPYAAWAALVAITLAVCAYTRRQPYLFTGWFWFVGTLVPVIGLIQVGRQSIADRYTYIPLIGLFILASWGLSRMMHVLRVPALAMRVACAALLVATATATRLQLRHWQNSRSLFEHALRVTDRNELAHNNLGAVLMAQGELDAARQHFEAALKVNPNHYWSWMNLGVALVQGGQVEEGLVLLKRLVAMWPTLTSHFNYGTVLLNIGDYGKAVEHLQFVVKLQPDFFNARMNLGTALTYLGRFEDALPHFIAAVKLRPDHPDALFNLGAASVKLGKLDQAANALMKCLSINPADAKARRLLAEAALKQRNFEAAVTNLAELVKLEPDAATAFDLAQLLVQAGKAEAAAKYFRIALELKPDWPHPYNNLALILATHPDAKIRNGQEAVALAERACALTEWRAPLFLSTLAAAYAEAGRFDDAVRTAERARALAEAAGMSNIAIRNEQLLELYRKGEPFRDHALQPIRSLR